jgi:hypothetical protein
VAVSQDFEFADKIGMAPERKVCLDSLLQAGQPQLLKLSSCLLSEWFMDHVGGGRPSPEPERCAQ